MSYAVVGGRMTNLINRASASNAGVAIIKAIIVRSNPPAAKAPAISGGRELPIRPIPTTKPVPLARISAGKVRARTA